MSKTTHNQNAKQCTIFDAFVTVRSVEYNTLTITLLEDCRGGECSYTIDPTIINQVLADFSGDASVKMDVSEDPTHEGLIITLTDSCEHPASTSQVHSNRIGHCERDEDGWVWFGRGEFVFSEKGGKK